MLDLLIGELMFVECLRTTAELDAIQSDWDRLNSGNPLQSWGWCRSWWETFGRPNQLRVLCFRDSGGLVVGLFPLYRNWTVSKGRSLELLGSGHACGDYQTFLLDPMYADDVIRAAVGWLMDADAELRWDSIDLDGVDLLDPVVNAWRTRMAERAVSITQLVQPSCWRLAVPADRDEYLAARSKPRRRLLRKQFALLEDPQSGVEYRVSASRSELHDDLGRVRALHQRRWMEAGCDGCFRNPCFQQFLPDVLDRLWSSGQVRVATIVVRGAIVAGSVGLLSGGVHYVYLTGMDPTAANLSPGWLLNAGHLLSAWRDGHGYIDFLRGDEPYKASLGAEPRAQMRLRLASRQPLAQVRHRLWHVGRYCRRWKWLTRRPRRTLAPAASSVETPQ